eukprot:1158480-Pelagomonas_calceolata.AAC.11
MSETGSAIKSYKSRGTSEAGGAFMLFIKPPQAVQQHVRCQRLALMRQAMQVHVVTCCYMPQVLEGMAETEMAGKREKAWQHFDKTIVCVGTISPCVQLFGLRRLFFSFNTWRQHDRVCGKGKDCHGSKGSGGTGAQGVSRNRGARRP